MWSERIKSFSSSKGEPGEIHEREYFATIEGQRLLLIHDPKDMKKLSSSGKYDIIVYGHTHKPDNRMIGETLVINPGECGGWVSGISTVGLLELPSRRYELKTL
jgi:uncharacterized protein